MHHKSCHPAQMCGLNYVRCSLKGYFRSLRTLLQAPVQLGQCGGAQGRCS